MILHLKEIMKERGITNVRLAEMLGMAKSTVSYWVNGHVFPTESAIERIAKVLDVPVCRLFAPGGKCCGGCTDAADQYRERFRKAATDLKDLIREWEVAESIGMGKR